MLAAHLMCEPIGVGLRGLKFEAASLVWQDFEGGYCKMRFAQSSKRLFQLGSSQFEKFYLASSFLSNAILDGDSRSSTLKTKYSKGFKRQPRNNLKSLSGIETLKDGGWIFLEDSK